MKLLKQLIGALGIFSISLIFTSVVQAKDYILTAVKPNKVVLVDAKARKVEKVVTLKNSGPGIAGLAPTPDNKFAFVTLNRWESIAKIDLDTGEEVMRIELSGGDMRVKNIFGSDISPSGDEIAVFESPVRIGLGELKVQPTRISIYDTNTGAKKRSFNVPRQITLIMFSKDGSKLYGLGRALYTFDPQSGKITDTFQTQNWGKKNFYPVDILDVWSQWEQAGMLITPYYTARSDKEEYWTGMLTLDIETGEKKMFEVEQTDIFYFSTAVSPANKNIAFGVYNNLAKFDLKAKKSLGRADVDHSYYTVNVSSDGKEVYLGGTLGDIAVYDADTLKKLANIQLPGGANMGLSHVRVIQR